MSKRFREGENPMNMYWLALENNFDERISAACDRGLRCAHRERAAHGQGNRDSRVRA